MSTGMDWINQLPGVGETMMERQQQICLLMGEAEALDRQACERREQARSAYVALKCQILEQWTNDQVQQAKMLA